MSTSISIAATRAAPAYGNSQSATTSLLARVTDAGRQFSLMYSIYCERRQMRKLSSEALHDMGISRAEIERECGRKFTDIAGCRR